MKTNTNTYCQAFENYTLCCIEDLDNGTDFDDIKDCLAYAIERYNSEFNLDYNKRRTPNHQARLADYIAGLPFGFAFCNDDILAVYKQLHGEPCEPKKEQKIIEGWWSHLALMLERIASKHGLSFNG